MNTIHELSDMLEKANKALLSAAQTIEVLGMENQKMREAAAKFYANQSPPQRTWVGLTDEETYKIQTSVGYSGGFSRFVVIVRAIEAKLKEKYTWHDSDCKHCVNGCPACDARRQSNVLP